jgi:hypothetical protein
MGPKRRLPPTLASAFCCPCCRRVNASPGETRSWLPSTVMVSAASLYQRGSPASGVAKRVMVSGLMLSRVRRLLSPVAMDCRSSAPEVSVPQSIRRVNESVLLTSEVCRNGSTMRSRSNCVLLV